MQDIEKFSQMVSTWKGAYTCAIQSCVGLKTPEGSRLLLYGRITFESSRHGIDQTPLSFETDHIFAARCACELKPDDVIRTVEKAQNGLMIGHTDVKITPKAPPASEPYSFYTTTNYHPLVATLFVKGEQRYLIESRKNFPRHLEWEVKVADMPFDTLDELLSHCGLPAWNTTMGQGETTLELVAKAPGQIDKYSVIREGKGIIECRAAKALDTRKLKIGFRIFEKNHEIKRGNVIGSSLAWRVENDLKLGKCEVDTGDAPILEAYLSYDGIPLDQSSISDPKKHLNPRYAIHQLIDPEIEYLSKLLFEPKGSQRADNFEGAVSTLLALLGFSTSSYGVLPMLKDGFDIVAITPSGHIAIVECTVDILDRNDKIAKLVHRTQAAKEKLTSAGYSGLEIQPVIVTALSREKVAASLSDAGAHGIAVFCKENLEEAVRQIALPLDAEQFFLNLKKLIPSAGNQSSLSWPGVA
jgi:hypothetical protein